MGKNQERGRRRKPERRGNKNNITPFLKKRSTTQHSAFKTMPNAISIFESNKVRKD